MWALLSVATLCSLARPLLSQRAHTIELKLARGIRGVSAFEPPLVCTNSQRVSPTHRRAPLKTTCSPVKTNKQYTWCCLANIASGSRSSGYTHQGKQTFVLSIDLLSPTRDYIQNIHMAAIFLWHHTLDGKLKYLHEKNIMLYYWDPGL